MRAVHLARSIEGSGVYVEPPYNIAADEGRLPELKPVIVAFGERIAMEETLDGAMAWVFSGQPLGAPAAAAPGPPAGPEASVKTLLDSAAPALARADYAPTWATTCARPRCASPRRRPSGSPSRGRA